VHYFCWWPLCCCRRPAAADVDPVVAGFPAVTFVLLLIWVLAVANTVIGVVLFHVFLMLLSFLLLQANPNVVMVASVSCVSTVSCGIPVCCNPIGNSISTKYI
jgi:hypothetical protein